MSTKDAIKRAWRNKNLNLKDSVARDHLALERTYLAWIRTGFAISALGIVIVRMQIAGTGSSGTDTFFKVLALVYIALGSLCIVAGFVRYARVEMHMENDIYPTGGLAAATVALCGLLAFAATFIVVLI